MKFLFLSSSFSFFFFLELVSQKSIFYQKFRLILLVFSFFYVVLYYIFS